MSKNKKNLFSLRSDIDQIDMAIGKLLIKRITLAKKTMTLKAKKSLSLIDKKREREIALNYQSYLKKHSYSIRIKNFSKALIALNSNYPTTQIVSSSDQIRTKMSRHRSHLNR